MRKPGNPNMKKGAPSVNPKGKPATMTAHRESLAEKMRKKESKLLRVLDEALDDPVTKNRVSAVVVCLERGWGRAAIVGDEASPLKIEVSREDELLEKLKKLVD